MPTKVQLDDLEDSVNVVISALKARPQALPQRERLRIEAMMMRLMNVMVANETATRRRHCDDRSPRRGSVAYERAGDESA